MAGAQEPMGLIALAPLAEAAPLFGQLLSSAARWTLAQEDVAAVRDCLSRALETTDVSEGIPDRFDKFRHFRARRRWRSAQRNAAEEILACGGVVDIAEVTSSASAPSESSKEIDLSGSPSQMLQEVLRLATEELADALAEDVFTPWSERLSAALALNTAAVWKSKLEDMREPDADPELRELAVLLTNKKGAKVRSIGNDAFDAFGLRVGRRFAANLEAHEQLHRLVVRLDREDRQKAEVAMVRATQGVRVALLMVVVPTAVAAGALLEIAVRQLI
jgi:hypothetical protein